MSNTTFQIGDKAWLARYENSPSRVQCPDCFGRRFLTVILGDDSKVTIECNACTRGMNYSTGFIETWEYAERVEEITIDGMECRKGDSTRYHYNSTNCSCYTADSENVFATREAAEIRASELRLIAEKEEQRNLENRKEYPRKSWGFNVSYHRRGIVDAKRQLAYHESKLEVAKAKASKEKQIAEALP